MVSTNPTLDYQGITLHTSLSNPLGVSKAISIEMRFTWHYTETKDPTCSQIAPVWEGLRMFAPQGLGILSWRLIGWGIEWIGRLVGFTE